MVCPKLSSISRVRLIVGSESDHPAERRNHQVPRVPLPRLGVTYTGETWTVSSESITSPSSLLRTHAPILLPLLDFGHSLLRGSPCRLLSAPAANRTFSTLFCESFFGCLSPYPGGPLSACAWFFLSGIGLPRVRIGSAPRKFSRENDFSRTPISRLQLFLDVQASEFACLPGRPYRCKFPCRAAEAFTSELNVHRYLCTHRICYPPDYRQLAERGLSPRSIHSIVDCSSHFRGAVHFEPGSAISAAGCGRWSRAFR